MRPYEPDDLQAVLELLRLTLGESDVNRRAPELFSWKHIDNPFGPSIMLVAEDNVGMVGFRAFMRWELEAIDGARISCLRPVDTATHPRARRQGIFRRLTMEAVDMARLQGVDLIFNTPNPVSKAGYLTMGWTEVGRIGILFRPMAGFFRGGKRGVPSVPGSTSWTDQKISHRPGLGLRTPRTTRYLDWRFRHPFAGYRVVGNSDGRAVVRPNSRRGRSELVVSDLFGPGAGRALRLGAKASDADYLVGWFRPGSPERHQSRSAGMFRIPGVTALTIVAQPLRPGLEWLLTGLEAWDLAMSDLELL